MRLASANLMNPARLPGIAELAELDALLLFPHGLPAGDPAAADLAVESLAGLAAGLYLSPGLTVVASVPAAAAGSAAVADIARRSGRRLARGGNPALPLATVLGGDLLGRLEQLMRAGASLPHERTGQPLSELRRTLIAATAAPGPATLSHALDAGARVVLCGAAPPPTVLAAVLPGAAGPDDARVQQAAGVLANRPADGGPSVVELPDQGAAHAQPAARTTDAETGPARSTGVSVWYVARHAVSVVLRAVDGRSPARPAWREAVEAGLARVTAHGRGVTLTEVCPRDGGVMVAVRIEAEDAASAEGIRRRFAVEIASLGDRTGLEPHPDFPATTRRELCCWPTSVPSDLLEWAVAVRPAAEWGAPLNDGD